MWGLNIKVDPKQAKEIMKRIVDKKEAFKDKNNNKKSYDQSFLSRKVYPLIRSKSIIHDSYLCLRYKDSEPFPTERFEGLFIGGNDNSVKLIGTKYECPIDCRPKSNLSWINC